MKPFETVLFALLFLSVLKVDAPAYGYLDPGTGAMLVQLLLGGAAGALVICKLYWKRIKALFGRRPNRQDRRNAPAETDAE
ncbi:MAG: hypothetical protein ACE5KF_04420 [Kiloniellaceae bacterium]